MVAGDWALDRVDRVFVFAVFFLFEGRVLIAMNSCFCCEDFDISAWKAESYVVAGSVIGRTGLFAFGTCCGVLVTLRRGTWCRMCFCVGMVRDFTLGGRNGCRFFFCVGTG